MSDYTYLKSVLNFLISNNIPQVLLLMQCIFTTGTPHNSHTGGWTHEVFFRRSCVCCRLHFLHWWYWTQPCQQAVTIVRRLDTTKKLKHVHPAFQLGELPCEWLKPTMCTWSQWEGGKVLLFPWDISALYANYGAVLKNKLLTISRHFTVHANVEHMTLITALIVPKIVCTDAQYCVLEQGASTGQCSLDIQ